MERSKDATDTARREDTPHREEPGTAGLRPASEQAGTSGVSDRRRAELERMEADAGTQHEAVDENVPQRTERMGAPSGSEQATAPNLNAANTVPRQSNQNSAVDKH